MNEPSSPDLHLVLERLQELQKRITSLEKSADPVRPMLPAALDAQFARNLFESQTVRDSMKTYERQQSRIHETFLGGASGISAEVAIILDKNFFPRLNGMFETARQDAAQRLASLNPDDFCGRTEAQLAGLEARFTVFARQFSYLQNRFLQTELAMLAAGDRLDAIWADQEPTGVGAWRQVMRSVAQSLDQEKQNRPGHRERFRQPGGASLARRPITHLPCPQCKTREVYRLARRKPVEHAMRLLFIAPYRCHNCGITFYR